MTPWLATVLTMFPEAFPGPLGVSLVGTAWRERDLWRLATVDIRAFPKISAASWTTPPQGAGRDKCLKRTWWLGRSTASRVLPGRFCT